MPRNALPLLTLLGLLFGAGCASSAWERRVSMVDEYRLVVEIEQLRRGSEILPGGFAHPATLNQESLRSLLAGLRYSWIRFFQKAEAAVFSPELVPPLAQALSDGLARCGPSDRVRFRALNKHTELKIVPVSRISRGVAFVKPEGVLNLAFDLVDDTPEADEREELFGVAWGDPTRRTISSCRLVPPKGTRLNIAQDGTPSPLWLQVPIAELLAPASPGGESSGDKGAESEGEPPPEPPFSDAERIHRLKYLEELFQRKVISEEQYKRERKRIFDTY